MVRIALRNERFRTQVTEMDDILLIARKNYSDCYGEKRKERIIMAKFDKTMALKIAGGICTVAGTVIGLITAEKDRAKDAEKAVQKILDKKN